VSISKYFSKLTHNENEEYGEGGITNAEMLQEDQENVRENAPANPPFIKDMTKVLVDATKSTPNDQILFAFGDCIMKGQTKIYSSAYRYLVTKLRSLGHRVVFYPGRFISQRFPMTGTQMQFSGANQGTSKQDDNY
jgi:hypothetical protein